MNKMRLLMSIFFFAFVAISCKLFYIQVINATDFSADYVTTQKIAPERGKILDRNHEPLAINQTTYKLFVEPKRMKDKDYLVRKLDEILQVGEATLNARIDKTKTWVAVKGNITKDTRDKVKALGFPEVGFDEEQKRYYPEASLAAHLVGFLGKDQQGENYGYFGVEGYYDKDLAGLPGVLKSERDLFGRPIFVGTQDRVEAENGRDFILTIDKTVQHIVKEKLKAGVEKYKAKEGCVVAADPYTMEILALSCLPDFDPDEYYKFTDRDYRNTSLSSVYEPGSTWKPLMVAAAIEEKKYKPDDIFDEASSIEVSGYRIKNWNDKYEGKISITRILEKSSNIGMVYTGSKLGDDKVYEYLQKYGVGQYTDVDLQGEAQGILKPKSEYYPIDYATATFGQGIAVTPLQLVRGFAAVINGGYVMRPYVVKEVLEGNYRRQREPQVVRRILSDRTSAIMRKMLVSVVEHAEAKWDKPKGYKFGGKTGTAQIAVSSGYDSSKTVASFIGFAPADKPKFLMLVVVKEPQVSSWGSETAAPIFFEIANELLTYYNIPPEY